MIFNVPLFTFLKILLHEILTILPGLFLLIHTVVLQLVFFRGDAIQFFLHFTEKLLYSHLTGLFEVDITFSVRFLIGFGLRFHLFQNLYIFLKTICL